jgi:hypothetical protein
VGLRGRHAQAVILPAKLQAGMSRVKWLSFAAVLVALATAGGGVALVSAEASAPARWVMPPVLTWYWQLEGQINNSAHVAAYDVDGFDAAAREVALLHAQGKHVICYTDVGIWEKWRPDAGKFPRPLLGRPNGWPGERWLDIRRLNMLEPIMAARFRMCARKGFDAVEPDNIDGYQNDTGFPLTGREQLRYDEWVAAAVHSLGMAVLQKNDGDQAHALEPDFDGALVEQCNEDQVCSSFRPYTKAGKPVLDTEYEQSLYPRFCTADRRAAIMGALYNLALNGRLYRPCWQ